MTPTTKEFLLILATDHLQDARDFMKQKHLSNGAREFWEARLKLAQQAIDELNVTKTQ